MGVSLPTPGRRRPPYPELVNSQGDAEVTGGGYRRPWILYVVVGLVVLAVAGSVVTRWVTPHGSATATSPGPTSSHASPGPTSQSRPLPLPDRPSPDPFPIPGEKWTPQPRRTPVQGQNAGASCVHVVPRLLVRDFEPEASRALRGCADAREAASVVLRSREDGRLGVDSAVLTFPVGRVPGAEGTPTRRHGLRGWWGPHSVVWAVAGQHARVRGDLPGSTLARIAEGFRVGRYGALQVRPVPGVRVSHQSPYVSSAWWQGSYSTAVLDELDSLGRGWVFGRTTTGALLEDRLLWAGAEPAGVVRGHPATFCRWEDGTAVLAWEVRPGVDAVVGYRGPAGGRAVEATLRRLAEHSRVRPPDW